MKLINVVIAIAILAMGGAGAYYLVNATPTTAGNEGDHGHGHEPEEEEYERGPNNGRLLEDNGLQLEVTIFEDGQPPQFRIYPYESGAAIKTDLVDLEIELHRFGGRVDRIEFVPDSDYLRGIQVVEEPHSFDVIVRAKRGERSFEWSYESYEGRVELSDDAAAFAGIGTAKAESAVINTTVELPGEIVLDAERIAHVVPRLGGVASSVAKRLGDRVEAGEVLAVIDSREFADAKMAYLTAREHRGLARSHYERETGLHDKKISPEQDYLEAKERLARTEIDVRGARQKLVSLGLSEEELEGIVGESSEGMTDYVVRSPISGVVAEKHVTRGEAVEANSDLFMIADLSSVWAKVVVYAKDLSRVHEGQKVTVKSGDLNKTAKGVISYISPLMGEQTRTATAIVEVANPDGMWRPGLYITGALVEDESEVRVAVPVDAIQTFRDWNVVFVKYESLYEIRPVILGRSDGMLIEIVEGLEPGEEYVAENSYVIKADIGKAGASHDH